MKAITIPPLAESITEGTIAKWLVEEGTYVEQGDPLIELETDKVNVEIDARVSGILTDVQKKENDDVQVDDIIAYINETKTLKNKKEDTMTTTEQTKQTTQKYKREDRLQSKKITIPLTPSLRKFARAHDLTEDQLQEKMGEIFTQSLSDDQSDQLLVHKEEKSNQPNRSRKVPLSRRKRTIANKLLKATQETAMLTTFNEIDMSHVIALRRRKQEAFIDKYDVKLGFMSFFTKAVVHALQMYPILNTELQGDSLIEKDIYDIGIAVASDEGLVVPVIRNADQKNFAEIEEEIIQLSNRVKQNELSLDDLSGGTFTITNGGVFGSLFSTPILNHPQVGILGMHTIQKRPVALEDDSVAVRPMMYVALSYDHQVIDGKQAVLFLRKVKQLIEEPEDLLLGL